MNLNVLTKKELDLFETKALSKNDILFCEGEECRKVGIILNGEIEISSYSENGNKIVYANVKKNEMFGNNLIFSTKPIYKGNIIAKSNSTVLLIDKTDLLALFKSNERFFMDFMMSNSDLTIYLNERIKLLSFDKAMERFLFYLEQNNDEIDYTSIYDLASILQIERETLSRLISKLCKEKVISRINKKIKRLK